MKWNRGFFYFRKTVFIAVCFQTAFIWPQFEKDFFFKIRFSIDESLFDWLGLPTILNRKWLSLVSAPRCSSFGPFNPKMSRSGDAPLSESAVVHNFSEKILEQLVHFHVMKLNSGFFLWVGSSPELSNLAVSMCSKYVSKQNTDFVLN